MTLAVPTHLVDTMGSATATGVEAAGHLLQDVGHVISDAADATTSRYRTLARSVRRSRKSSTTGRNLVILGALAAVALVFVMLRRSTASSHVPSATDRTDDASMSSPASNDTGSNDTGKSNDAKASNDTGKSNGKASNGSATQRPSREQSAATPT